MKLKAPHFVLRGSGLAALSSELLRRAREGDPRAFDELIARYTPRLYKVAWRFAGDEDQAETIVQETWLRAWRARARMTGEGDPFPWLATIAANTARDLWRKRRPLDFADLGGQEAEVREDAPTPEESLLAAADRERLLEAVRALRAEHRMVIALRYDAGLSYAEIAESMHLPLNTVRTHLRRAKAELRAALERDDG